jgi:acid phosphatase class B
MMATAGGFMIVTFDFDDTLTQSIWDPEEETFIVVGPNFEMLDLLHMHLDKGNQVHIVTSRWETPENKSEILLFLLENGLEKLEKNLHFTNGRFKAKVLDNIRGTSNNLKLQHHDDDPDELEQLEDGCEGVLVSTLHGIP